MPVASAKSRQDRHFNKIKIYVNYTSAAGGSKAGAGAGAGAGASPLFLNIDRKSVV